MISMKMKARLMRKMFLGNGIRLCPVLILLAMKLSSILI